MLHGATQGIVDVGSVMSGTAGKVARCVGTTNVGTAAPRQDAAGCRRWPQAPGCRMMQAPRGAQPENHQDLTFAAIPSCTPCERSEATCAVLGECTLTQW